MRFTLVCSVLALLPACGGGDGGSNDPTGHGGVCVASDPDPGCETGLTCQAFLGGTATQCLLPCLANADCADPLTRGATTCWKCSTDTNAWHCASPQVADCCALACTHIYQDCGFFLTDGGSGNPLDEAGCVAGCNNGTMDSFCMAAAECTSEGIDACLAAPGP